MADEIPLAPGQVYGFRFWHADLNGELASVSHSEWGRWKSGENVAACMVHTSPEPLPPPLPRPPRGIVRRIAPPTMWKAPRQAVVTEFDSSNPQRQRDLHQGKRIVEEMEGRKVITQDDWDKYRADLAAYPAELADYRRAYADWKSGKSDDHVAPVQGCSCGFYLVKSIDVAMPYVSGTAPTYFGVVKGYGRTVPMDRGWKVQKAKIVALMPWSRFETGERVTYHIGRMLDHRLLYGTDPPPIARVERKRTVTDNLVLDRYPDVEFFTDYDRLALTWGERVLGKKTA